MREMLESGPTQTWPLVRLGEVTSGHFNNTLTQRENMICDRGPKNNPKTQRKVTVCLKYKDENTHSFKGTFYSV